MSDRDIYTTSQALQESVKVTMQQLASTRRQGHDDILSRFIEKLDEYVDARIAEALDRENNRGAWSRY